MSLDCAVQFFCLSCCQDIVQHQAIFIQYYAFTDKVPNKQLRNPNKIFLLCPSSRFFCPLYKADGKKIDLFKNVVLTAQTLIDYSFKKSKVSREDRVLVCPSRMALLLSCVPYSFAPQQNGSSRPLPRTVEEIILKQVTTMKEALQNSPDLYQAICAGASWTPNTTTIECRAGWFVPYLTELLVVPISHKNLHNCGTLLTESLKKKKKWRTALQNWLLPFLWV